MCGYWNVTNDDRSMGYFPNGWAANLSLSLVSRDGWTVALLETGAVSAPQEASPLTGGWGQVMAEAQIDF